MALGICENKTHPLQDRYNRHPEARYLHSEIACIKNAVRIGVDEELFKRSTLYVCRQKIEQTTHLKNGRKNVTKKWTSGLACPCEGCASAISAFDIGSVIYSLDNEGYAVYE